VSSREDPSVGDLTVSRVNGAFLVIGELKSTDWNGPVFVVSCFDDGQFDLRVRL